MSNNTTTRYYIGIDIAKKEHAVSIINQNNQVVVKNYQVSNNQAGLKKLMKLISKQQQTGQVQIACEATGHYWLNLFGYLWDKGIDLTVFNPLQVASFRNSWLRGSKTDSSDSILIAKVLKFGVADPRELPNETQFKLKELSRFRTDLSQQATAVKLKLIKVLDQVFPEFTTVFKNIEAKTATHILSTYPHPEALEAVSVETLTQLMETISRSYFGEAQAKRLKQKASETIGLKFGMEAFSLQLKLLLAQLKHLNNQIDLLDQEIKNLVEKSNTSLLSIPGISHTIAGTIIGETANFKSKGPQSFLAFSGLDPKKRESGTYKGKTRMSKRGSRYLRHALWLAASSARMHSPTFKKVYQKQKDKGKHHNVAISHVAKKMAYIVDAILRTNEQFKEQVMTT